MTFEEAKEIFLNRGYEQIDGGSIYNADKWRDSVIVISDWLQQEPCEDAISREAVLYEIHKQFDLAKPFKQLIESMPSVQPKQKDSSSENPNKWIPVSERLPKENGWYQCTVTENDVSWTMDLFYKNGKWLDNRRIGMFNMYDMYGYGCAKEKHKLSYQELISEFDWTENVIAWMSLSKPYELQKSEEE